MGNSRPDGRIMPGEERRSRSVEIIALRESSVITLARVGALNDLQVAAAFRLARLVQTANAEAGSRFRQYVDGGERTPLAERATEAMRELRNARQLLGRHGYSLAVSICAEGHALADLYPTRRQRDTASDVLRVHLDELVAMWRLAER